MRVWVDGELGPGVGAKDLVLHLIATIGAGGGTGHALEYAGPAVRALSMDARMTLCNMAAGAELLMLNPVFDEVEQLETLAADVVPRL